MIAFFNFYRTASIEFIFYSLLISGAIYGLADCEKKIGKLPFVLLNGLTFCAFVPLVQKLPYHPIFATQGSALWGFYIAYILVLLLYSGLFLRPSLAVCAAYTMVYLLFILLYKMAFSSFYSRETSIPAGLFILIDLSSTLLLIFQLILLTLLFQKVRLVIRLSFRPLLYAMAFFYPVSIFLYSMVYLTGYPFQEGISRSILYTILLITLPIFYYIFASVIQGYNEQKKLDQALQETRAQVSRYRYSLELDERIRKERHELKNNYFYIQMLLKDQKYEDLDRYLTQVIGEKMEAISGISTGNLMLDYILNRKITEARNLSFPICTEVSVPAHLNISEDRLCTILLNLLDNAIEASRHTGQPDIHITIRQVQGYLLIKIRNHTDEDVLAVNPELFTTKKDKQAHGLGMRIVSSTVRELGGSMQVQMEQDYFCVSLMIPDEHHV